MRLFCHIFSNLTTLRRQPLMPTDKVAPSLKDRPCTLKVAPGNITRRSRHIKQWSYKSNNGSLKRCRTSIEHCKVIAMIKHYLARRVCLQRSSAQVVNRTLWLNNDPQAGKLNTPAEVNLLHMCKKVSTQPAKRVIDLTSNAKGSTADPKDLSTIVILPQVLLCCREYSTSAEWIAQKVDKSTRSTCILKLIRLLNAQYLRTYGCNSIISLKPIYKRIKPTLWCLDIRV